jgi:hypothetical protein
MSLYRIIDDVILIISQSSMDISFGGNLFSSPL